MHILPKGIRYLNGLVKRVMKNYRNRLFKNRMAEKRQSDVILLDVGLL